MPNLKVLEDAAEIVHYENSNIPIYARIGRMSYFSGMRSLAHWHDDIEIMKALQGHFSYQVNGREFLVEEGDAVLVNSRQPHYGYSADGTDCRYLCVLFRPELLAGNAEIKARYVDVILQHPYLTETFFSAGNPADQEVLACMDAFLPLTKEMWPGYELEFMSRAYALWLAWFRLLGQALLVKEKPSDLNLAAYKKMVAYIYQNYAEKLALSDIARAGGVCRSKCCAVFQTYLGRTPIAFLNDYRLQVGMHLLSDATRSITEIALACGFNSPSYFAELFLREKGCTPRDYRREQQGKEKWVPAK